MLGSDKNSNQIYQSFIDFIERDIQNERRLVNRRMLSVFFWCFLLPALISITVLLLVKLKILPRNLRNHLDWLVLILPIFYSLYILGSEVLAQVPSAFRRGGVAISLGQPVKEGVWRERVIESLEKTMPLDVESWDWIISSFKMDLQAMQYRNRYLTALAGAVFFLLMQGIDSLTDGDAKAVWMKTPVLGWVETTGGDLTQFVGLALFLVLLYLSGGQTYQSLLRYLNCAQLVRLKQTQSPVQK